MKTRTHLPTPWARSLTFIIAVAIAALLSSCAHFNPPEPEPEPPVAEKKPPPKPIKPPPPSRLYEWYGSDEYVSRIEVDINAQKAVFFSGDKQVGWTTVASGIHKYPTPTGTFAVTEKVQNKKSNLYGKIYNKNGKLVRRNAKMGVHSIPAGGSFKGAPMPYFLRLTNDGIGMHAGPIPRPGNRASHGCIRMPKKFAPILYRYVEVGTPVTIKGNGPSYASYAAKQRRSTPKPAPAAVVKTTAPPVTPVPETTTASATPHEMTGAQPASSSGTATTTSQPTEAETPAAATAAVVTPALNAPVIPGTDPAYESGQPSPMTGYTPPSGGAPAVPAYSTPYTGATETDRVTPTTPPSSMAGVPSPIPSDVGSAAAPAAATSVVLPTTPATSAPSTPEVPSSMPSAPEVPSSMPSASVQTPTSETASSVPAAPQTPAPVPAEKAATAPTSSTPTSQ